MLTARLTPLAPTKQQHTHVHHQLVFALQGVAEFEIAGQGGVVAAEQACLVPSDASHEFAGVGDNRMLILDLAALADPADRRSSWQRLFDQPRYLRIDPKLHQLLHYVQLELPQATANPLLMQALGQVVVQALHHRVFADQSVQQMWQRLDMQQLQTYVAQHLERRIAVAELAALMHLSVGHFYALFKQQTGMTPQRFLLQQRLEKALFLLRETQQPLAVVAENCGFSSQSALTSWLRKHYGITPRALRLRSQLR
ncbi:hypothetical protein AKN94_05620 [Thiopseudomonas alkaliphila]|uniref:AraC family transcriptional regulator n=1 Tax=Thiopseudomonas alkaliphila TaxID=1697053 RepID=UPI00069CE316|nr:AraC family transcriptional regulator [Thiopseudomonas alkaliphila]AKX46891.1 hypothetical protein AKN94_05620 [Thiopseudomonas alkaliphila]